MDIKYIENFFSSDLVIKKLISESCISSIENGIDYQDRIYETLKYIELLFDRICSDFSLLNVKEFLKKKFDYYMLELANTRCDITLLSFFYEKYFCDISNDFIDDVNRVCCGYSGLDESILERLLGKAVSINEILHVIHSYIINNDQIYESIPILMSKNYINGYSICLRGNMTVDAKKIYDEFQFESDNGYTDILSLNNKIVIMVRDRGHALVVEIEKENEYYYVKYFIPKICNIDMVNSLPGVRKVDSNLETTNGEFRTVGDKLASDIVSFIEYVPTDADIPYCSGMNL